MATETNPSSIPYPDAFTLAQFWPSEHGPQDVARIGESERQGLGGVAYEHASAFGYELPSPLTELGLSGLIGVTGKSKYFQENLPEVQARLGTGDGAAEIAHHWALRVGFGDRVLRSLMTPNKTWDPSAPHVTVVTGGVPNWMERRSDEVEKLAKSGVINRDNVVLLAAGTGKAVGPDLPEGTTQAQYMESHILPNMRDRGFAKAEVLPVASSQGRDVAKSVVEKIASVAALKGARILVVSNAGAWPENAGQLRRMAREADASFDVRGDELFVASDSILVGRTGVAKDEPPRKYQNPLTAIAQTDRNFREFFLQAS